MKLEKAERIANNLLARFTPLANDKRIEVVGSVRRRKADPNDVELTIEPKPELYRELDAMVDRGEIRHAVYPDGKTRWGMKQRGFIYDDEKVEFWLTDDWNHGATHWLRTGPGPANHELMGILKARHSPYHSDEGYWYYEKDRIPVGTERQFFDMLGLPFLDVRERSVERYHEELRKIKNWKPKPHVVEIWTANSRIADPDGIDIDIKTATLEEGQALAPTWDMISAYRRGVIGEAKFTELYRALIWSRYMREDQVFSSLLRRKRIVLKCGCQPNQFCHRHLAVSMMRVIASYRKEIRIGYCGELGIEKTGQLSLF